MNVYATVGRSVGRSVVMRIMMMMCLVSALGGLYGLNGAMLRQPLISSRMNSCCSLLAFFIVNVS